MFWKTRDKKTVIGLMSGTSVDSVDACCARMSMDEAGQMEIDILAHRPHPIPPALRKHLLSVMHGETVTLREVSHLNVQVGELFAEAALGIMEQLNFKAGEVDCIGSHGQTLCHVPPKDHHGSTFQIGEPSVIAERTGVLTVADFRPRDMAVGGQGAPLVCFADQLIFQHHSFGRCVQNIGGISNVTVLPPKAQGEPIAFDTGPGNMLMDGAMQMLFDAPCDVNGEIASVGRVDQELLQHLLEHPFLKKKPPKTTGREMFGHQYLQEVLSKFGRIHKEHILATLTYFTAKSIADSYEAFVLPHCTVTEVIVGGGGVYNRTLMQYLTDLLGKLEQSEKTVIRVKTHEDYGISNKAKEALAFGMLGWAAMCGMPNNVPSCTGASRKVIGGKVVFP